MKKIIAISTILAGLAHISYVSIEHWSEFPQLEFAFFVSAGLAQIIWAITLLKKEANTIYYLGLLINGSLLITWILTRTVAAPFQSGVEPVGTIDTAIAALEVLSLLGLISLNAIKNKPLSATLMAVLLIFGGGTATYSASMGTEVLFPDRVFTHTHGDSDQHEDEKNHMPGDDHPHEEEDKH